MAVQSKSFCVQALRVKKYYCELVAWEATRRPWDKSTNSECCYVTINVQLHQASGRVEKGHTDIKLINYGNEHV